MAWEEAAHRLPGALGQEKDVLELSASEMEERRFDEQVGVEALTVPEASAPPQLKPHLIESWWKARTRQLQILSAEVQPPPQVVEHSMFCFYPQAQVQKEIQSAS